MPDLTTLGQTGLKGWRVAVGDRLAGPISQRTPLRADQVRALFGAVFFGLALKYVVTTARDLARQARG